MVSAGVGAGKECAGDTFQAHESDCNKYYICQYGQLLLQACPDSLYWSGSSCDWPENTKCKASSGPDSIPTTTARPATTEAPEAPTELATQRPGVRPPKPDSANEVKPVGSGEYKVVCYFTNWAWYR